VREEKSQFGTSIPFPQRELCPLLQARIAIVALIRLIIPEEQTISTAYPFTISGIPALIAVWRGNDCPCPALKTLPKM
jgi:hypothetical protein